MSPWDMVQSDYRYLIVGLVPRRRGAGFLKKRYSVARCRDEYEALCELFRLTEEQRERGAYSQGRWTYAVLDVSAQRGKLAPAVSEQELRDRALRAGALLADGTKVGS